MKKKIASFDWSSLNRVNLYDFLWSLNSKIVGKQLTINEFHSLISKHLKSQLPIRVVKQTRSKIEAGRVHMGGTYYSYLDQKHKKSIEIFLVYNKYIDLVRVSDWGFKRLCTLFADTILHEIIHMRQYRRRKFKIIPDYSSNAEKREQWVEQSYLGCTDEIDAYSFNIACEVSKKYKNNNKKIIEYLNKSIHVRRDHRDCWKKYLHAFNYNHKHPIIKRVKKKVIGYLPYAQTIGKPFKSKDWINY